MTTSLLTPQLVLKQKGRSVFTVALLVVLGTVPAMISAPVRASDDLDLLPPNLDESSLSSESQTSTTDVPELPAVRIGGAGEMARLSINLGRHFKTDVPGANVEISSREVDSALDAVLNGNIDLAAIDRPLSADERAMGLMAVPLGGGLAYVFNGPTPPPAARPFLDFINDAANEQTVQQVVAAAQPSSSSPDNSSTPTASDDREDVESAIGNEDIEPEGIGDEDIEGVVGDAAESDSSDLDTSESAESELAESPTDRSEADRTSGVSSISQQALQQEDSVVLPNDEELTGTPGGVVAQKPLPWWWLLLPLLLGISLLAWLRRSRQLSATQPPSRSSTDQEFPSDQDDVQTSHAQFTSASPSSTPPSSPSTSPPLPSPIPTPTSSTATSAKPPLSPSPPPPPPASSPSESRPQQPATNASPAVSPLATPPPPPPRPASSPSESHSSISPGIVAAGAAGLAGAMGAMAAGQKAGQDEKTDEVPDSDSSVSPTLAQFQEPGLDESSSSESTSSAESASTESVPTDSTSTESAPTESTPVDVTTSAFMSAGAIATDTSSSPDSLLDGQQEKQLGADATGISTTDQPEADTVQSPDIETVHASFGSPSPDISSSDTASSDTASSDTPSPTSPSLGSIGAEAIAAGLGAAGLGLAASQLGRTEEEQLSEATGDPIPSPIAETQESDSLISARLGSEYLTPVSQFLIEPSSAHDLSVQWEMPEEQRRALMQRGNDALQLNIYDVTGIDLNHQPAHDVQTYPVPDAAFDGRMAQMIVPVPVSDRDYLAEVGYVTPDNQWMSLGRSLHTHVPAPLVSSAGAETQDTETLLLSTDGAAQQVESSTPTVIPAGNARSFTEVSSEPASESQADMMPMSVNMGAEEQRTDMEEPPSSSFMSAATGVGIAGLGAMAIAHAASNGFSSADELPASVVLSLDPNEDFDLHIQWDIPEGQTAAMMADGSAPKVRIYDVTDIDLETQPAHSMQEYEFALPTTTMNVSVPQGDRDYLADVGYINPNHQWQRLARSLHVRVPISYLSDGGTAPPLDYPVQSQGIQSQEIQNQETNASEAPPLAYVDSSLPHTASSDSAAEVSDSPAGPILIPNQPFQAATCRQELTINSHDHCYVLDEFQCSVLQSTARSASLDPGCYVITIEQGSFSYWTDHPEFSGEPLALLWLYGGRFINKQTDVEATSTWVSLNGFNDVLTLDVLESTTLAALFFDTYREDNSGDITLLILKDD